MSARSVCLAFVLLIAPAAAQPAFAQVQAGVRASTTSCDGNRLVGRDYSECLRKAQEESEKAMSAAMAAAAAAVDKAPNTPAPQRQRWKRSLEDVQALWVRFRNAECQDVAPFETTNKARVFEERNACIIDHNVRRTEDLRRRYP
jgi:uncharacterized protein YecT (DUF1311 family)